MTVYGLKLNLEFAGSIRRALLQNYYLTEGYLFFILVMEIGLKLFYCFSELNMTNFEVQYFCILTLFSIFFYFIYDYWKL